MFDAIIVGARCAGASTALLLARKGYRVLCVDKAVLPGDTLPSHYIPSPGVSRLQRWRLLDRLTGSNCPPISRESLDTGRVRLSGASLGSGDFVAGYCVRRKVLDLVLLEAAAAAGAEVRQAFSVQELLCDDGHVSGIRGCTREGVTCDERARIVIGADGMHSVVSRRVQAREYNVVEPLTCNFYGYWSGVPVDGLERFLRPQCFIAAAPTNDGLTVVNVLKPRAEFREFRTSLESGFSQALELAADLARRVRAGRREEAWFGTADTTNYFRQPYGPGWALVGDAGYHRDAITTQGITDALRDAELLAEALHAAFSGCQSLPEALAEYHCQRDAAVESMFKLTCSMARLAPLSTEHQALLEALLHNPEDTRQFLGTLSGSVSIPGFYAKENVRRILAAGVRNGVEAQRA